MAQTTPPTITASPAVPLRGDKVTFSNRVDAFLTWLAAAVTQFGAVATNVYNNAVDTFNSATAAAGSASAASTSAAGAQASADAAVATSGAALWVSGTTYTAGQVRYSPIDYRSYRRKTAGAGTTDPSVDLTNWVLISAGPTPYLHVREEQPSGTASANAGAVTTGGVVSITRVLNTVKVNTISGAALSANSVTLPAGTYEILARAPSDALCQLSLVTTGGALVLNGSSHNTSTVQHSFVMGQFTLGATTAVILQQQVLAPGNAGTPINTGQAAFIGRSEVYAEAIFKKVA